MKDLEDLVAERVASRVFELLRPMIFGQRLFLTEREAMKLLGVSSPTTMRRLRNDGLPAYQPTGKQYYYFKDDLIAFVKRNGRAV